MINGSRLWGRVLLKERLDKGSKILVEDGVCPIVGKELMPEINDGFRKLLDLLVGHSRY